MPVMNKDGTITLSMQELQQLQSQQQQQQNSNQNQNQNQQTSFKDKWAGLFGKKPAPANGQQQQQQNRQQQQQKQGQQQQQQQNFDLSQLSPDAIRQALAQVNFFNPTPEQQQKIAQGDMSALVEAQNAALREAMVSVLTASTGIVKNSTDQLQQRFQGMIGDSFSRYEAANQLRSTTQDILQIPGGETLVAALTQQFSQAHPDKTPAEWGQMANEYISDFANNYSQANSNNSGSQREALIQQQEQAAADF